MERIEDVFPENLVIGKDYLVTCLFKEKNRNTEQDLGNDYGKTRPKQWYYTPIIPHLHDDKENGQIEKHYHIDDRFSRHNDQKHFLKWNGSIRPKEEDGIIKYISLQLRRLHIQSITSTELISKSKLPIQGTDCKLTCPHRGYDLSKVAPIDGVITCPLHGLKFDMYTHRLI